MENNEQQTLIGKILGWIFGVILCLSIFAVFEKSTRFMGLAFTIFGVLLIPPVNMYVRKKFSNITNKDNKHNIKIINGLYALTKIFIFFIAVIIGTIIDTSMPKVSTNNQVSTNNTAQQEMSQYDKMVVVAPVGVKCKDENSSECVDVNYGDIVYVVKNSLKNDFYKLSDGNVIHKEFVATEGDEKYNQAKAEDEEYQKQKAELKSSQIKAAEDLIKGLQDSKIGLIKSIKENSKEPGYWDVTIDENVWKNLPYENKQQFLKACEIYGSNHSSNKFESCIGYGYYDGNVYFPGDTILKKPMKM